MLAPTDAEILEGSLDRASACLARLGIRDALIDAVGARLGVQDDFAVHLLSLLTDAERTDVVENVALQTIGVRADIIRSGRNSCCCTCFASWRKV